MAKIESASQGTTPCYRFVIPNTYDIDFTLVKNMYATLEQGYMKITKQGEGIVDIQQRSVVIELTQAESLRFKPGDITVQLNWTYPSGRRGATKWKTIPFSYNTERRVLD